MVLSQLRSLDVEHQNALMRSARESQSRPSTEYRAFAASTWISAAEFAVLRAHPALCGAVAARLASIIELYDGNRLRNTLLCDRGRILIGFFLLYLDVLPLPGTDTHGASSAGVQALCRRAGLCSAGRVVTVLAAMCFGGYLTPGTDPHHARRRILVPTHKLIAIHHQHWVRQFEAMASIFPHAALVPARLESKAFCTAFLYHLGTYFFAGFRVLDHVPILTELAESNAGLLVLSSLALSQLANEAPPGAPVRLSISALSRRFCVSRAHVRKILVLADSAGLLVRSPRSECVTVRPLLSEALISFFGTVFILFDRCATAALADTDH